MIVNKFIRFISRYISFLTINFALSRKHPARFSTSLTAQDISKLTKNERNTGICTTQSSGKGMNG